MNRAIRSSFALLFALSAVSLAQTKVTPAGHWEGSITTPAGELKVIVDLSLDIKGTWIGDIDIPDQGARDLPLRNISISDDSVTFGLPAGQGDPTFKGKLSADGATIAGDFFQGGGNVPFTLKRIGDAKVYVPESIPEVPEKFVGKWEGKLETPAGTLRLVFNISNKDGAGTGTIDSLDQGAMGIPISLMTASENSIKIGVRVVSGEYTGKLSEDGKTLTGEWAQGGGTLALVLTRK